MPAPREWVIGQDHPSRTMRSRDGRADDRNVESARRAAVEVTLGASLLASDAVVAIAGRARAVAAPVAGALPRAPVPKAVAPSRLLGSLRRRGSMQLLRGGTELSALLDRVVPLLLEQLLR